MESGGDDTPLPSTAARARDLHLEFREVFGQQTIERLLIDSYQNLAAHATVTRWFVVGAERYARQR